MATDGTGDQPLRRRLAPGVTAGDLKAFMAPYVARFGYRFNTEADFVDELLASELAILEESGDIYCPCRLRTGDPKIDADIVCPCIAVNIEQFAAMRKCWCGLFIRTDVADGATLQGVVAAPSGPVQVRVAAEDELCEGEVRHLRIGKRDIALVRTQGEYFALSDVCRHAFAPLSDGFLDGYALMCPRHGWRYDVRDGTTDHPDANVRTYPVEVRGNEVFVTVGR